MSVFQLLTTCKLSLGHNCSSVHSPLQAHFVAAAKHWKLP